MIYKPMIKYVFVGGMFTPENQKNIEDTSKGVIQYAADALQKSYVEGLFCYTSELVVFNLPFVGSYPILSKLKKFKPTIEFVSIIESNCRCYSVGFNNLVGYKNVSRYYNLKKRLSVWIESNKSDKICIVVYAAHTPFMKACVDIKRKFPQIRLILIVPDLPEYMSHSSTFFKNCIRYVNIRLAMKLYHGFDGFILLSEYMKDKIPINRGNYRVIEGMYSSTYNDEEIKEIDKKNDILNVIYTGTLARRYGILNLIAAFMKIPHTNARLIIVGAGDAEDEIRHFSTIDERILFLGQKTRSEVLKIQLSGTVLVNPRTSEGAFTKYSFPSKTMEYLASGIPTIINKLPGIPKEYLEYSFQPKDESVDSLSQIILEVLNMPINERLEFGRRARKFILEQKGPRVQCKKLIELSNEIFN